MFDVQDKNDVVINFRISISGFFLSARLVQESFHHLFVRFLWSFFPQCRNQIELLSEMHLQNKQIWRTDQFPSVILTFHTIELMRGIFFSPAKESNDIRDVCYPLILL